MATNSNSATANSSNLDTRVARIQRSLTDQLHGYLGILLSAFEEEGPRVLESFDLPGAAEYMSKCSNVVVMCGASISTSAGILDFRSPGTELYSKLEKCNLPFPEAIFQLDFFRENPKPFFVLAKELYPNKFNPTPTHYFIRLLNEKGKLLRTFTENIDSLERIANVPTEKIVEANGTFFTAHCLDCQEEYSLEQIKDTIFKDEIPYCNKCTGVIKPDIVFSNENLPKRYDECVKSDFAKCDFLIIIGTSLAVAPFCTLISHVDNNCPRLLINMVPGGHTFSYLIPFGTTLMFNSRKNRRDVFYKSTCDDGVMQLVKLLGWESDFKKLLQKEGISISSVSEKSTTSSRTNVSSTKTTTAADSTVPKHPKFTSTKKTVDATSSKSEVKDNAK
ncbi:unnamed protein product [Rotaria socialis]|uniref:NAD-dependent protein deacetylase n=1 Tax=Rotaria socialis TaxID=392032 RepID=A0A818NZT7_9BILA|nr:unnamed protein product [Rotaria socialis]